MENIKCSQWNQSYENSENNIYYPKEESVKFINRYIRKRVGGGGNTSMSLKAQISKLLILVVE